jgi:hypothetical protein
MVNGDRVGQGDRIEAGDEAPIDDEHVGNLTIEVGALSDEAGLLRARLGRLERRAGWDLPHPTDIRSHLYKFSGDPGMINGSRIGQSERFDADDDEAIDDEYVGDLAIEVRELRDEVGMLRARLGRLERRVGWRLPHPSDFGEPGVLRLP